MSKIAKEEKIKKIAPDDKPVKVKKVRTKKEVAKVNKSLSVLNPQELILKAIEAENFDIDKFERLVSMANDFEDRQAEKLFNEALAKFQSICPVILKDKATKAKNKKGELYIRNYYAPLGTIIKQVKKPLSDCGFTYIIDTEPGHSDKLLKVFCILFHKAGHSKRSSIEIPFDTTQYMNDIQKVISTQTYAKRIVFCNVAGIMTADKDDDGNNFRPVENGKAKKENSNEGAELCKAEYKKIMAFLHETDTMTKQEKIEARKEADKNIGNLVYLRNMYKKVIKKPEPKKAEQQEIKLSNAQINKMATDTLSKKDKKGNRIFDRDESIKCLRVVETLLREGDKIGAVEYINGILKPKTK